MPQKTYNATTEHLFLLDSLMSCYRNEIISSYSQNLEARTTDPKQSTTLLKSYSYLTANLYYCSSRILKEYLKLSKPLYPYSYHKSKASLTCVKLALDCVFRLRIKPRGSQ